MDSNSKVKTQSLISQKAKDPPRYPRVINQYEGEAKKMFRIATASLLLDLVKEMTNMKISE